MALREASTNVDYIKWSEVDDGAVIKGFYIESKPSAKYPDNQNHYLETIDGKRYGLNGKANLDRALEQVRPGWYVEITYKGKTELTSGPRKGTDCHQFGLAFDDERIHPLFSGDAAARQEVEYKNSEGDKPAADKVTPAADKATPALVKPEQAKTEQAASAKSEQASEPAKKRSIF